MLLYSSNPSLWGGGEPEVLRAEAKLASAGVDRMMKAEFRFDNGIEASMSCSLLSWDLFGLSTSIEGDRGRIEIFNPIQPSLHHSIKVVSDQWWTEHIEADTTYYYQLKAFYEHVVNGAAFPTAGKDSVNNMRVIDAVYRAAGLMPRAGRLAS